MAAVYNNRIIADKQISNGVGNLVKTFLDVSGYGEDVTNIAESLYDGRDKRHRV